MLIKPLNDVILIKLDPMEGPDTFLAIPDNNSEMKISDKATIVAMGPKCKHGLKVGQRILYQRFRDKPQWVEVNGEELRMIYESYVLAVIA